MNNGMIKVVTGIRWCGKTYLLFNLFGNYLRNELHVDNGYVIEIAPFGIARFRFTPPFTPPRFVALYPSYVTRILCGQRRCRNNEHPVTSAIGKRTLPYDNGKKERFGALCCRVFCHFLAQMQQVFGRLIRLRV